MHVKLTPRDKEEERPHANIRVAGYYSDAPSSPMPNSPVHLPIVYAVIGHCAPTTWNKGEV